MANKLYVYKPLGMTPLQLIHTVKQCYPEYEKVKLSYAGRLDPMAEGLLLILAGEENKKRKEYEALQKTYECDVLFGIETDTYDILGKITNIYRRDALQCVSTENMKHITKTFLGKQTQPYPPYSSQPVQGKPLFYWARENKLDEITIPTKDIEIFDIENEANTLITTNALQTLIHQRIEKVHGDFRQTEILQLWDDFFVKNPNRSFPVFSFRITCSSGTYIRSFAHNLGKKLGTGALALSIKRTHIGSYDLHDAIKIDIL